ncbi:MAG: hypothetical protein K0U93_21290 [Gammaproteobacteria bacterium]|nr:hypothetical protein [Gammaproteobacteria bacterium]
MSIDYASTRFPVRSDFAAAHQRFWDRLAEPGQWWTAAERCAIAAEVREAFQCATCRARKAALSPFAVDGPHAHASDLDEAVRDVVHRVATDASRLTRTWFDKTRRAIMSDEAYVEVVGTVVALVSIDQFCSALGLPLHPLPAPQPGSPTRYRPRSAQLEDAWVPLVPAQNAGTPEADLWISGRTGNVIRAMSLVPDEVRTLSDLSSVHYLPNQQVRDPSASQGQLDRAQMELVAGRVSALNGCFY